MSDMLDILVFPVLGGYLLRIPDGSRRPPTVFLTAAQLRELYERIGALLTTAEPPLVEEGM